MSDQFTEQNEQFFEYLSKTFSPEMKTPSLIKGSISSAILQTFGMFTPKPLFIYLHNNEAINHELFFMQNICNEIVNEYFNNEGWSIWPVDVTAKGCFSRLLHFLRPYNMDEADLSAVEAPTMILIVREHLRIYVAALMCSDDPMIILNQLYEQGEIINVHLQMIEQIKEGKRIQARIRKEQKQLALEQEQEKAKEAALALEMESKRIMEEELQKSKENERESKINLAKSQLKQTAPSSSNYIIKFRLPNGNTLSHEFAESNTVKDVMYFVESQGFIREEISVLFSYPSKNMCNITDVDTDLKMAGLNKREMINVQIKK